MCGGAWTVRRETGPAARGPAWGWGSNSSCWGRRCGAGPATSDANGPPTPHGSFHGGASFPPSRGTRVREPRVHAAQTHGGLISLAGRHPLCPCPVLHRPVPPAPGDRSRLSPRESLPSETRQGTLWQPLKAPGFEAFAVQTFESHPRGLHRPPTPWVLSREAQSSPQSSGPAPKAPQAPVLMGRLRQEAEAGGRGTVATTACSLQQARDGDALSTRSRRRPPRRPLASWLPATDATPHSTHACRFKLPGCPL